MSHPSPSFCQCIAQTHLRSYPKASPWRHGTHVARSSFQMAPQNPCSHSSRRDQDLSTSVPRSRPRQLARFASGRTSLSSASAAGSRVSWRTPPNLHKEPSEHPTATKTIDLRKTFIGDDRSSDDVRWIRSILGRRSADRTKDLLGRHGQSRRDCW
jgi:hypothetical protein